MYSKKQIQIWNSDYHDIIYGLMRVHGNTTAAGLKTENEAAREHLVHGVSRRLMILRTTIENIFSAFPLDTTKPLGREVLVDCEINLHAFVINLSGIFDNWAWAFVFRHNLEEEIGNRQKIGLFKKETQKHLPSAISKYLQNPEMIEWHDSYLKGYRDALAHRIPLYIPPAQFTEDEGTRFNAIEEEKIPCIISREWERLEQMEREQKSLGKPYFAFMESFNDEGATRSVFLHPQMLSDAMAITEFGELFMKYWDESA